MKKVFILIIAIAIALFVGFLSGFITSNSVYIYDILEKPPLSPPSFVFGYVWTFLYILMGVSSYIACSKAKMNCFSFWVKSFYIPQLIVNFFWSILFFSLGLRLLSFFWILLLIYLVGKTIKSFSIVSNLAAVLLYPYLLWICFAAYLNLGLFILN